VSVVPPPLRLLFSKSLLFQRPNKVTIFVPKSDNFNVASSRCASANEAFTTRHQVGVQVREYAQVQEKFLQRKIKSVCKCKHNIKPECKCNRCFFNVAKVGVQVQEEFLQHSIRSVWKCKNKRNFNNAMKHERYCHPTPTQPNPNPPSECMTGPEKLRHILEEGMTIGRN